MRAQDLVAAQVLTALLPAAAAQQLVWQKIGAKDREQLLYPVVFIGDVDRDGWDDLATRVMLPAPQGVDVMIDILSGRDGRTLRRVAWPPDAQSRYVYGNLTRAGDVDVDGWPDYAAMRVDNGGGNPDCVDVRSGKDDRVLWTVRANKWSSTFGLPLLGDVDLDGDGRPDLLIGDTNFVDPAIHAYDHAGRLLYRIDRTWPHALGRMGDLDRDGCADFVFGNCTTLPEGGACVISGRTGKPLVTGYGEQAGDYLGSGAVSGCGDVDGDGTLDFVAASFLYFSPDIVRVFSGRDAKPLRTWRGAFGEWLAAGDLDLDGVSDLVTLQYPTDLKDRLSWRSLRDGMLVTTMVPPPPQMQTATGFGATPDIGRPQPGSPAPVFVVAEPGFGISQFPSHQGRLCLYRALPPGAESFGSACAGTLAGAPRLGARDHDAKGLRLHVTQAPGGAPAALLLGLSRTRWGTLALPMALDSFGFPGCSLFTSIDVVVTTMTGTAGNDRGYAHIDLPWPLADTMRTLTLHGQWLVAGQGPTAGFTSAMSWGH